MAGPTTTGMDIRMIYRLDRYLRGGDHTGFLAAGFPAARFTEPMEDFAHQHQDVRVDETASSSATCRSSATSTTSPAWPA